MVERALSTEDKMLDSSHSSSLVCIPYQRWVDSTCHYRGLVPSLLLVSHIALHFMVYEVADLPAFLVPVFALNNGFMYGDAP